MKTSDAKLFLIKLQESGKGHSTMGHSDISVTMNTYTHLGLEDAAEEMKRLGEIENARMEQEKMDRPEDDDEAGGTTAVV